MNKKINVLIDDECEMGKKPEIEKPCELRPCEGVDWVTSAWSGVSKQNNFQHLIQTVFINIFLKLNTIF